MSFLQKFELAEGLAKLYDCLFGYHLSLDGEGLVKLAAARHRLPNCLSCLRYIIVS